MGIRPWPASRRPSACLFEGGRLRSQLQEQGALYDGAVEQYNASIVQALAEVANALVRINSVHEQQALASQAASPNASSKLAERLTRRPGDAQTAISAQLTVLEQQQQAVVASKQLRTSHC
jgi:outer membrane protein TolC